MTPELAQETDALLLSNLSKRLTVFTYKPQYDAPRSKRTFRIKDVGGGRRILLTSLWDSHTSSCSDFDREESSLRFCAKCFCQCFDSIANLQVGWWVGW